MDNYVRELNDAVRNERSKVLAKCLSLRDYSHCEVIRQYAKTPSYKYTLRSITVGTEWRDIVELHIAAVMAEDLTAKFDRQEEFVKEFLKMYKSETGWLNMCMGTIITDYRCLATQRDTSSTPSSQASRTQAARHIQAYLTPAVMDRNEYADSRRWGTLYVANNLLKMYLQVTSKLGDNVIRSIEHNLGSEDVINERFPKAEVVTYRYMVGLQLFYKGDYIGAVNHLIYAFDHCLATSHKNKRLILLYLVPCRLWMGISPTASLLKKYKLGIFVEISKAVRQGNIRVLNQLLANHEDVFVHRGLYLIMDRLRLIAYRNLIRTTVALRASITSDNAELNKMPNVVELDWFVTALAWQGDTKDPEEAECIIANLIYENFIRGYIHRSLRKLVLSKQRPFPPISEVIKAKSIE